MSHRQDASFFDEKRAWSARKDRILGSYLTAYLPKIASQNKPILLVDGFAGAGRFEDGTLGSPLIIADAMAKASVAVPVSLLAIEPDPTLFARLTTAIGSRAGVELQNRQFLDVLPDIEQKAKHASVFMFVDPFAVRGLDLGKMERVFANLKLGQSVELLLNFNAPVFVRWALASMKRELPTDEAGFGSMLPETGELNAIVGGDWWRDAIAEAQSFDQQLQVIVHGYCKRLSRMFRYVCYHAIMERSVHSTPKYVLVFASRHPDALELMNDEVVKSDQALLDEEHAVQPSLYHGAPTLQAARDAELRRLVYGECDSRMSRGELILRVLSAHFGVYLRKEIRGAIEHLLRIGRLQSSTGKSRINDSVTVFRCS